MSRKGRPNKLTQAVRDRVEHAFNAVNGPHNAGLIKLADEHPAIFYSLVAKLIPVQASLSLTVVALDLGQAIRDNQRFLESHAPPIDVTPSKPASPLVTEEK